jgi:ATP-dependent DNA helicase RecG
MTDYKLGADSKLRIDTMVKTNNGFIIAETDLSIRGPGDLLGTQQSGALDLLIADLGKDGDLLQHARDLARQTLQDDPELEKPENRAIKTQIESTKNTVVNWSRIS